MKLKLSFFLLILYSSFSYSVEIIGRDYNGADLIPNDNDILKGTFINVGEFRINPNTTVYVFPQTKLVVYASTITIYGKLNAIGRGSNGGIGGAIQSGGENGFGNGYGKGGGSEFSVNVATGSGGGGGGYGGSGGSGYGNLGGLGGSVYGSTIAIQSVPISPDDIDMGSGGGGGGGGNNNTGGTGGAGGGSIYLEAKYIVINGTITADGLEGGIGINVDDCTGNPGGGGGGSGGGILIKAIKNLVVSNDSPSLISANGGNGGSAMCLYGNPPLNPGGGGSGGRVKILYNTYQSGPYSFIISTNPGRGGEIDFSGTYANSGSLGTVSFGVLPSSPTGFKIDKVFITSVTYSWDEKTSGWGGPVLQLPQLTTYQFRLYSSTPAMPFSDYFILSTSSDVFTVTENDLTPNTTIYRFLTAFTDYGDSMPSNEVSTYTFACPPKVLKQTAFSQIGTDSITFSWSSGPINGKYNPPYTIYEVSRSTVEDFSSSVSTTDFIVGLSSTSLGLLPNTTYYFRVRALGLNNIYTSFSDIVSTATLAIKPANPSFLSVYIDSMVVTWSTEQNPPSTIYQVQISSDNFLTVFYETFTVSNIALFKNLDPGCIYFLRVRALNRNGVPTDYSIIVSTIPGSSNKEPPPKPQPPWPISKYSYDGYAKFIWYPVPNVYRWWLEIGTQPGERDFLYNYPIPGEILEYSTNTLLSGKTYYARIRAESSAGVFSEFSEPGPGVSVWISQTEPAILKPYNWPNPFDPHKEDTNIGFNLREPARVTLKIFTLGGQKVYEETKYENSAGNHVFLWSGRNEKGKIVEPGGYIGVIIKHYSGGSETQKLKIAVLY